MTTKATHGRRGRHNQFDISMGTYDGAEVYKFVDLYIPYQLENQLVNSVGLYGDDGLANMRSYLAATANHPY